MKRVSCPGWAAAVLIVLAAAGALAGTAPPPTIPAVRPDPKAVTDFSRSLIRVNSTLQAWDFVRPWTKKQPGARRGTGVVVGPNRVLVTATMVAHNTFIELEKPAGGQRTPAKVVAVDYDANLALLEAQDPKFLEGAVPVFLDETARVGSVAEILQLEPNGEIAPTAARLTTITIAPYAVDDIALLVFRLTAPLQQRDGSFFLPAVREGRLLGLVMRYDNRNQTTDVIPPPVIRRFLKHAEAGTQGGFPRAGITMASLQDPQLRQYLGVKDDGGVMITAVTPRGPAAKAGVQPNDVLLAVDDRKIDADGNFQHPDYGRIGLSYLITTEREAGDTVTFTIVRQGQEMKIPVVLERRNVEAMSVPVYWVDKQPYFLIAGGLIFHELTRPFLQEWGGDWRNTAPQRLVYADLFQDELRPNGDKVVFLAGVLPSPATLGYEQFSGQVVASVDGEPVRSLQQLALKLLEPGPGILAIGLDSDPRLLFVDKEVVRKIGPQLARHYGITQLHNLPEPLPDDHAAGIRIPGSPPQRSMAPEHQEPGPVAPHEDTLQPEEAPEQPFHDNSSPENSTAPPPAS